MVDLIHVPAAGSRRLRRLEEPAAWSQGETRRGESSRIRVAVGLLTDLLSELLGQELVLRQPAVDPKIHG